MDAIKENNSNIEPLRTADELLPRSTSLSGARSDGRLSTNSIQHFHKKTSIFFDPNQSSIAGNIIEDNPMDRKRKLMKQKTFQIDSEHLKKYKQMIKKRFCTVFVIIILILLQRVFPNYGIQPENSLILYVQKLFEITPNSPTILLWLSYIGYHQLFALIVISHIYVTIYYLESPQLALKIMLVHFNAYIVIIFFQIIFADARPFWIDSTIVPLHCPGSFPYPSLSYFTLLMLFLYAAHCWQPYDDESHFMRNFFLTLFGVFLALMTFIEMVSGFLYIYQQLLSICYVIVCYEIAKGFDKGLNHWVEHLTVDVNGAKRYTIYLLLYIILLTSVISIAYNLSNPYLNVEWEQNLVSCMILYNQQEALNSVPIDHLIGAYGCWMNSNAIFILLGASFGAAKAFRDYSGQLWFNQSRSSKVKMTIIANICLIPSWLLLIFENLTSNLVPSGIQTYMIFSVYYSVVFYVVMGVLPKHIFAKLNYINEQNMSVVSSHSIEQNF